MEIIAFFIFSRRRFHFFKSASSNQQFKTGAFKLESTNWLVNELLTPATALWIWKLHKKISWDTLSPMHAIHAVRVLTNIIFEVLTDGIFDVLTDAIFEILFDPIFDV